MTQSIPDELCKPCFPLIKMRGEEGKEFAGLNDFREKVPMYVQDDFGLFALLYSVDIDRVLVTAEVQKLAAKEWLRRYPIAMPETALWWRLAAESKAKELSS